MSDNRGVSDTPPGPGYWKASDGHWYPPTQQPGVAPPPFPPPRQPLTTGEKLIKYWWVWCLLLFLGFGAVLAVYEEVINPPEKRLPGKCVTFTDEDAVYRTVSCDGPNEGTITKVVSKPAECPAGSEALVKEEEGSEVRWLCIAPPDPPPVAG